MRDFDVEKEMYRRAVELIEKRYPVGWGGAGVVHTANGHYFTSVSIDTANASAVLCIETGAMLEAHKYNERVTHCMKSCTATLPATKWLINITKGLLIVCALSGMTRTLPIKYYPRVESVRSA